MFLTCKDYNFCWVCPYFCNLVHHIRKVFRCNFWMFHFDAKTPKRTSLWSSSASIGLFWTSKLKKVKYEQAKRERGAAQPRPCRSYRDAEGRVRYHGTSELKQTEFRVWNVWKDFPCLPPIFGVVELFPYVRSTACKAIHEMLRQEDRFPCWQTQA